MIANLFGPDLGYVVIIILVVLVGGSQLPKIARNIGTAGKEFRKAHEEAEAEEEAHRQAAEAQPPPPPALAPPADSTARPAPELKLSQEELESVLRAREQQTR
ncbi:MAG: twin-arginine translocase TatA/TatE family subunit [Acidimicrobiaceae bacterium]|nr:twin-arginine translocase TatA/TatE family subunit [Acidimicrobiaceae bacterium]